MPVRTAPEPVAALPPIVPPASTPESVMAVVPKPELVAPAATLEMTLTEEPDPKSSV
ncbi:MAG: hypothetical protein ACK57U_19265 [Planctomycetota bacterium]